MPSTTAALALLLTTPALRPRLSAIDLTIVALYLVGITLFGLRFREKKSTGPNDPSRSLRSYFLANNTIPWWAIALSIVSAETSTLTIISIPGVAFAGDFGFLQVVLGYMLGRIVVAALFLPRYFSGNMLTAYQLIDQRFGSVLHKVTAGLFLLTRAAAEGVRVFAVSIVVGIAIGTKDVLSIAIISALTLLYTFEGGMAAVIWTDVVQMAIYIFGTFIAIWSLGHHIPGGWSTIHHVAGAAGKFHMFNFALNLTTAYTFWAGVLGGTFLTMASHGTDQLMVQRMLAARSLRESRLALLSSGAVIFMQFALFLLIGAGLYVFAQTSGGPFMAGPHPVMSGVTSTAGSWIQGLAPDRIFPTFIVRELPIGIAGLLVAAILAAAMSNLSAALNSLSSTTVVDFYMHLRPHAPDRERNLISKSSTVLWAIVLFAIAIYSLSVGGKGHVVEIGLSIASVAYGCLLGVFLLGTLTKFATQTATTIAMLCGFALNLWLWQGTFPVRLGPLTIPHIAFTWYVLIGAIVTFALGTLFSLLFRKQSKRNLATVTLPLMLVILSGASRPCDAQSKDLPPSPTATNAKSLSTTATTLDFTPINTLLNAAIAAHKLPGAVVVIGHNNQIVFHHAYGLRKLENEPGLDGIPSPAEPMTESTLFDMASLTKCLATATAIMQLYEAGKLDFDAPLEKYLPAFNPTHDPQRSLVTIRLLLTHTSGEPPDVNLKDDWGLDHPDKSEGIHRALTASLKAAPGSIFTYSDINFILLGYLVETLSGESLDAYAQTHIFKPLAMSSTRYHAYATACGSMTTLGSAIDLSIPTKTTFKRDYDCYGSWRPSDEIPTTAPTAHDNEGTALNNPDFDHLLRGTVHDPTTRRMGGVAGHAGVFSNAHDIALYAQALLSKLRDNTGPFPLKQSTLQLMTSPEQPGHTPQQIPAANAASQAANPASQATNPASQATSVASQATNPASQATSGPARKGTGVSPSGGSRGIQAPEKSIPQYGASAPEGARDPLLAAHYPAIPGQNLRDFGWDIDTAFSKPRGAIFPIGSFGHTGFTGTSLWMDPASNTYVILLANAIHPRGNPPISNLRGDLATTAAIALGLYPGQDQDSYLNADPNPILHPSPTPTNSVILSEGAGPHPPPQSKDPDTVHLTSAAETISAKNQSGTSPALTKIGYPEPAASGLISPSKKEGVGNLGLQPQLSPEVPTLTGIDILQLNHFAPIAESVTRHRNYASTLYCSTASLLKAETHFQACSDTFTVGLFTNQSGLDRSGRRTIDILAIDLPKSVATAKLTTLFSPEHGITGALDTEKIDTQTDPATHLPVVGLYGAKEADRRPTHAQLKDLDAVVIDLQDAGVHFWTYEAAAGYFLEAAAAEQDTYHHDLEIILLDRPNLIGGIAQQGPVSDPGSESYVNYMPLPVRHGLTLAELMQYAVATKHLSTHLTVVPMQHWQRPQFFADTQLPWTPPSPNLRTPEAAILYPALGLIETTNLSVGRGTPHPFSFFGAAWMKSTDVVAALTARNIPGVTFNPTTEPIAEDANHYPFHGQSIEAVRLTVTDRNALDSPELGVEILAVLHRLYPVDFQLEKSARLLCNRSTLDSLTKGRDPRTIATTWLPSLNSFHTATTPYLLYP